jgi:hypothetical protein
MFSYLFSCMLETGNTYLYLIIKEKEFPWFGPFWSSISTKIFVRHPRLNASSRRPRASPTRAYAVIAPKSNLIPLIQATRGRLSWIRCPPFYFCSFDFDLRCRLAAPSWSQGARPEAMDTSHHRLLGRRDSDLHIRVDQRKDAATRSYG